ncbi:family 10 glycosylhydrolase [Streptomyces sp. NBS 14/10]|uniref:glycoside hydrolase family 10 protein n=1 Tax=Streptomyces sp. NBS 14/10 TaxID=1945643 RepID=UPI000B7D361C|nr:family 10 glycosylhydrolase [Streptomyces sp. NBS 14/10]KAK1183322.1 family 10 glycosylhydrolase [Streptomyces sp. NBS 14/10]NUS83048.1 family 10 glycosylhydrolase [Streptomyces sp.]
MGQITRRGLTVAAVGALAATVTTGSTAAYGREEARGSGGQLKRQFRGMWLASVANRDWPSKPGLTAAEQRAELLAFLDTAVERRLNAVVFQVRPTADALWPSRYEPWAEYLTGVQGRDPGWDPLGTAVREAHRRGLELHAWFNPYRVANHTDPTRLAPTHPARLHPEWVVPYGGKLYYNPGLPEVRRFVQDAMLDAVARYDVDAVHWDDYFYPYPVAGQVFDDDAAYERHGAGFPDRAAWRRDNIDRLVRETAVRIKRLDPRVRFGISPFAVWRNQATDPQGSDTRAGVQTYDDLYADTRKWVREAWIDYIVPQVYWNIGFAAADYAKLVPWWAETVRGTGVDLYIGEALYKAGDPAQPAPWQDPAELSRHLTFDRDYPEVRGNVYFSAKEVAADRNGAMARVVADHYPYRVRPPR